MSAPLLVGQLVRDYHLSPEDAANIADVIYGTALRLALPAPTIAAFAAHESGFRKFCYSDRFYYSRNVMTRPNDTKGWPARSKVFFKNWGHTDDPLAQVNVWGSFGIWQTLYETAVRHGFAKDRDPWDLFDPATNAGFFALEIEAAQRRGFTDLKDLAAIYNSGKAWRDCPSSTRNSYVPEVLRLVQTFSAVNADEPVV